MMARTALVACLILFLGLGLIHAAVIGTLDIAHLQAGVVKITSKSAEGTRRVGTGFLVKLEKEAAYIVTAAHVVAGDSDPKVEFFTKRNVPLPAEVLGLEGDDELRGLALLIVKGRENLPNGLMALPLASVMPSAEGVDIMVIGFPRNQGPWAVAKGNISSRQGRDLYFSPAVDEGYSGGPIIQSGKVIGMVGGTSQTVGRGVAVRSVQDYIEGFGITVQESTSTASTSVGSSPPPAASAKLEPRHMTQDPEITGKDGVPMVLIPAGSFMMGSPDGEGLRTERPVHEVRFPKPFAMARYETTFEEYDRFAQATGRKLPYDAGFGRGRRPVINVSGKDAKDYAQWLSQQTGKHYRLPTEAEWEYAARSGGKNDLWAGTSEERQLADYAVFSANSQGRTAPVGEKKPNGLGLYDMSGNVWERVEDCWHDNYQEAPKDGSVWGKAGGGDCDQRVLRGGSLSHNPVYLRASSRLWTLADSWTNLIGFRLAQDID